MRKLCLSLPAVVLLAALNGCGSDNPTEGTFAQPGSDPRFGVTYGSGNREETTGTGGSANTTAPDLSTTSLGGVIEGSGNRDGTSTTGATENTNATDSMAAAVAGVMYGSGN